MRLQTMRRRRLIWRAAGVLLLVSLGGTAVSGQDDKPAKSAEAKRQDDKPDAKPAEAKSRDDKPAKAEEAKGRDDKPQAAVEVVVDSENMQFAEQWGPQFRQLYKAELRFMRLATEPTKQQYDKIAAEGEPSVKVAMRAYATRFNGGNRGKNSSANPSQSMTDAIAKAVAKHLLPEQAARYQKELVARTASYKRMAVDNLVAMVDKALFLSADQRTKLVDVLGNNWDESWNQAQYFMNQYRWFPPMPDAKILPILTEPQRVVWKGITKNNVRFGIGGAFGDNENLDEETWPEVAAKKDEVLPPPKVKAPDGGGKK
jgi:hypothetical protein